MDSKHVCKFCNKSFPCGRSLGGHIRSHLVHRNTNLGNASNEEPKLLKQKDNPKKPKKSAFFSLMSSCPSSWSNKSETEQGSNSDHGKGSIFVVGNNCNSSASEVVEPEKEEVAVAMSLIMLSRDLGKWGNFSSFSSVVQSSNNISLLQTTKSRRRRGIKNEEKGLVYGAKGKIRCKKSENLEVLATGSLPNWSKMKKCEVSENGVASNDQSNDFHESKISISSESCAKRINKMEVAAYGYLQNGPELKESNVFENGFATNDQPTRSTERKRKVIDPDNMNKKSWHSTSGQVKNGSKMKKIEVSEDGSAPNDQSQKNQTELSFHEITMASVLSNNSTKTPKFECTTCNKVFHSYQALGGHRASHKKLVGMKPSPPKLEPNDHEFPANPPNGQHHQQHELGELVGNSSSSSSRSSPIMKLAQKHECPICFKVFPSGQALGGHKRSHLLAANLSTNANNGSNKDITVMEKSSGLEMREFLDLNLPPEEEDATIPTSSSSNNLVGLMKPYWWVESSHKHEPLLELISN